MKKLFKHLPMTESQVLQSTRALNAVESSHPGRIPQTMFSPVQPGGDKQVLNIKKKNITTPKETLPIQSGTTKNGKIYLSCYSTVLLCTIDL